MLYNKLKYIRLRKISIKINKGTNNLPILIWSSAYISWIVSFRRKIQKKIIMQLQIKFAIPKANSKNNKKIRISKGVILINKIKY